jgi:prepilin-type processing-associated H-X9-DG protein
VWIVRLKTSEWIAIIVVGALVLALVGSSIYPALHSTPQRRCLANLEALARASQVYCADTAGLLPPAKIWTQALLTRYVDEKSILICPATQPSDFELARLSRAVKTEGLPIGYALNKDLALTYPGYMTNPKQVPMFFDSTVIAPNATASIDTLDLRHEGKVGNVVYVDGHTEALTSVPVLVAPQFKIPEKGAGPKGQAGPGASKEAAENASDKTEPPAK